MDEVESGVDGGVQKGLPQGLHDEAVAALAGRPTLHDRVAALEAWIERLEARLMMASADAEGWKFMPSASSTRPVGDGGADG